MNSAQLACLLSFRDAQQGTKQLWLDWCFLQTYYVDFFLTVDSSPRTPPITSSPNQREAWPSEELIGRVSPIRRSPERARVSPIRADSCRVLESHRPRSSIPRRSPSDPRPASTIRQPLSQSPLRAITSHSTKNKQNAIATPKSVASASPSSPKAAVVPPQMRGAHPPLREHRSQDDATAVADASAAITAPMPSSAFSRPLLSSSTSIQRYV